MVSTDDNWQSTMPDNWQVQRVAETGSTNADLFAQAQNGAPHHSALMADNQTAGRGRLDRTWEAKAGANLLVSLLFRKSHDADQLDISLCQRTVAVSAVRACRDLVTESENKKRLVMLKWPNDLLLNSKKFGGMLSAADAQQNFIVVGIGINLGWAPDEAAKLKDFISLTSLNPVGLLQLLLEKINLVESFSSKELQDEYVSALATLGKSVRIELTNGEIFVGRATSLDQSGRLVVETDGNERVVDTGDVVHLREANQE